MVLLWLGWLGSLLREEPLFAMQHSGNRRVARSPNGARDWAIRRVCLEKWDFHAHMPFILSEAIVLNMDVCVCFLKIQVYSQFMEDDKPI